MCDLFNYLHLITFLNDKLTNFLIAFYLYVCFLIFILILFFVMSFRLKAGKYNILWPISILKYSLPLISSTFFGQIFILLISAFKCQEGRLYYNSKAVCTPGAWFYATLPISSLAIIFQLLLSYITISMNYKADFIEEGNDLLKKRNSISDTIFLLNKILIIIIFGFDKEKEGEHWLIIFVVCILTGLNAYGILFLQNHENIIIKKMHYFYSLFLFWGFLSLLLGKIFKSWKFNGAFYLFILGILLILIYCLFYSKTYLEFIHLNFEEINSSQNCINYIKEYLKFINKKEICRESSMIITTFIEKMEEGCTNENCILKKYLISLSKGFDSNSLLFQFAQKLFKIAINKFPKDVTLRIHYIIFLLTKANQKKNAQKELYSIKPNFILLDDNFKIYQCKKYLEEYSSIGINDKEEMNEYNDFFLSMEYKNNLIEFKKLLSKSSYLYYEFWTSLYNSHLQGTEDLKKLNDIGAELNELIEFIEKIFLKLQTIKSNDLITIDLYESYAKYILNDKEKYEKYYNIQMNLITDDKMQNKEVDFSNYDLKVLNENDEYKYLIISANEENKGIIMNISLNACIIFGYDKHEIIGKNMNLLIPEIYHKNHNILFNENTEKTKIEFFENLTKNNIYNPKFHEISAYGRNKSKYLIPLDLKIFFVQTEESDLAYIIKLDKKYYYKNILNENIGQICCVLTDKNFLIQTFTSNCVEILGLNSKIINSNFDITNFIKQFNEELQLMINNKDKSGQSGFENSERKSSDNSLKDNININIKDKSYEHILRLKRKLLKEKYIHPRKIIWRIYNNPNGSNLQLDIGKTQISLFAPQEIKYKYDLEEKKNFIHKHFTLEVKEASISGKHIGYYFDFQPIKVISNDLKINNQDKIKNINVPLKSNLKRPSVKFVNIEEESAKSSRLNDDDEENSRKSSLGKVSEISSRKNSTVIFDLENVHFIKKYESATILGNILDQINNINDKFLPTCNFNFYLDLVTMSYKPSTRLDSCNDLFATLKFQSMQKINILYKSKKKEKMTSSFSSEKSSTVNSNSSYDDSIYSSLTSSSQSQTESNISNRKKSNELNNTFKRKNHRKAGFITKSIFTHKSVNINDKNSIYINNENTKEYDFDKLYYKVNINKIKFMVYDFIQEMVISQNIEKKSQMEIVISNYKTKNSNCNINKDLSYPNIFLENSSNDPNKRYNSGEIKPKKKVLQKEEKESKTLFDKEKEFEKEIIYALSKQDEQKSIIHFYQISIIFIIIIILIGISEIFLINNNYSNFKENLDLVIDAANLKYNTNIGVYLIREKILCEIKNNITNGNYDIPNSVPTLYIYKINELLKNCFTNINSILEDIIGSKLSFCKQTKFILKEKLFYIDILYNDDHFKIAANNFYSTFIHIYSCFCVLLNGSNFDIHDTNIYNFLHNIFNNVGDMLDTQVNIFKNELNLREKEAQKTLIIFIIIYIISHLLLYFLVGSGYCSIAKKKESYISAFYGIGLSLIKSSIKKCELFINKINKNEEKIKARQDEEETSSLIFSNIINLNDITNENSFERKSINIDKSKISKKIKKQNGKNGDDKKSRKFKFFFYLILSFSLIYLIGVLMLFRTLIRKFINYGNKIFSIQKYHNNILEIFNAFREFLFDEKNIIHGLSAFEYLTNIEDNFYSFNENTNYITDKTKSFCNSYLAYFNSEKECQDYMGGKDGILSLGFHLIVHSFLEEIRNSQDYAKLLMERKLITGNLTELTPEDVNDTYYGLDTNKTLIFRMRLFNLRESHFRENVIFLNLILQYITGEKEIIEKSIRNALNNSNVIYMILISIYQFLFFLYLIFYWFPMIKRMNDEIYKTKKMLCIIPVQILASHPNIKELLNISMKNDKAFV